MRAIARAFVAAVAASAAVAAATDVFVSGQDGVPQYRIPALVQTGVGTLLAFAEARFQPSSDCGYKYLVVRRSVDGGTSWGGSIVVAGARADNSTSTGNPQAVYHGPSGRVVVVFSVQQLPAPRGCSPSDGVFVVDDGGSDGVSWGAPTNITGQLGPVAGHVVPGPGAGLVLTAASGARAGRLVMSGTRGAYGDDAVFTSDDGGATWAPSATTFPRMDESALVELADGTVLVNFRTDHANATCDCRAFATSVDGGATFSTPVQFDPTLIEPVCQASLLRVGASVFFANPASRSARANVTVRRGDGLPGGWVAEHLVIGGAVFGGYTSMAGPLSGGAAASAGILYEYGTATAAIGFAPFPLAF